MVHEDRATAEWIIAEGEAACVAPDGYDGPDLLFHDTLKHPQMPSPFGRFVLNRDRDVMMTPQIRAWTEDTWLIEVIVQEDLEGAPNDDPTGLADTWAE